MTQENYPSFDDSDAACRKSLRDLADEVFIRGGATRNEDGLLSLSLAQIQFIILHEQELSKKARVSEAAEPQVVDNVQETEPPIESCWEDILPIKDSENNLATGITSLTRQYAGLFDGAVPTVAETPRNWRGKPKTEVAWSTSQMINGKDVRHQYYLWYQAGETDNTISEVSVIAQNPGKEYAAGKARLWLQYEKGDLASISLERTAVDHSISEDALKDLRSQKLSLAYLLQERSYPYESIPQQSIHIHLSSEQPGIDAKSWKYTYQADSQDFILTRQRGFEINLPERISTDDFLAVVRQVFALLPNNIRATTTRTIVQRP